ncbi:MAG TPA: hypothetical protein VFS62_14065 [Chloroflexota bacterium]|nr:hypothetical protein [Chloroflexota bacterium]
MKQIIARVDDELAEALKRRSRESGESVNAYLNRLLRVALSTGGPGSSERQLWKANLLAKGLAVSQPPAKVPADWPPTWSTPAGYAAQLVSEERDER